jgi:hypothetical protein
VGSIKPGISASHIVLVFSMKLRRSVLKLLRANMLRESVSIL